MKRPDYTVKPTRKICSAHFSQQMINELNLLRVGSIPTLADQQIPLDDPVITPTINYQFPPRDKGLTI